MFKKTSWRNTVSDAVSSHQDQALNTTIFLLKSFGPTGFLLREEGDARPYKVCLGDPHTCTCAVFTKEQEPCKHICWVLLRKFRIPREHEYSFQHGLVERQISEVLHGLHQPKAHRMENDPTAAPGTSSRAVPGPEPGSVCRKPMEAQDVCPICQEELLERKLPVSYCRFGCGNNVHISCMKVWADHQRLRGHEETVKCPLCREDFSSVKFLQEQVKNAAKLFTAAEREKPHRHLGVFCHVCQICPITGKCFKCTVCSFLYLCEDCSKRGCHPQHPLASRTKRRDEWHLVDQRDEPKGDASQSTNDSILHVASDHVPENVLGCLPTVQVRSGSRFLDEGQQCRICLQSFTLGQRVRTLPCHHKFHADCVDEILRKSNSCPLDGFVIYNPLTWRASEKKSSQKSSCSSSGFTKPEDDLKDLFVPGVALLHRNASSAPSRDPSETIDLPHKLSDQFVDSSVQKGKGVFASQDKTEKLKSEKLKSEKLKTEKLKSELKMTGVLMSSYHRKTDI
ncbi:E3 ubiquitin-protein ligase ZSWIM2 [Hippoglossus stenolepis]|uniref:E3 ubiquitin-protein ligase ZSWIM2 n=1 Tax=Hippoglossus stenolepis TaxID=195615 RepID=UPI001FAEB167|nr:E3 ubiquitin-protein ligase ZSWIM2 [Hippoglossus stenolepis]XP_035005868.2 E3 ubiquitin-protein ligase ZSWIM2 [Hippoglossus stenolepis]